MSDDAKEYVVPADITIWLEPGQTVEDRLEYLDHEFDNIDGFTLWVTGAAEEAE